MSSPRGQAAVRLALSTLLIVAFGTGLLPPVHAGSEAAPEIQDPTNDRTGLGGAPTGTAGLFPQAELAAGWVQAETDTTFELVIKGGASIPAPSADVPITSNYTFAMTYGGKNYLASVVIAAAATPGGVAKTVTIASPKITFLVEKSSLGTVTAGSFLTGLFLTSRQTGVNDAALMGTDRAPNTGFGMDYFFTKGAAGASNNTTNPNDTDRDLLNDTCEQRYFGGLNGTNNASEDRDNDTLTNGQECALGTDPTNPDSDGDGTRDDQDPFPTDPTQGGSGNSTSNSTSSSNSTSNTNTTTGGTSTSRSTTTGATNSTESGSIDTIDEAVEKLKSDLGYLGGSAGGLLAVLVLCMLALAVRWSL